MPVAWQQAKAFLGRLGLKVSDPDFAKITMAMEKAKKGMEFWATLGSDKLLSIEARIGSTVVSTPSQTDLSADGVVAWRAKMQLVHDQTQLMNDADLAKFQKANPDPAELAKLRDRISGLDGEISTLTNTLKAKIADRGQAEGRLHRQGRQVARTTEQHPKQREQRHLPTSAESSPRGGPTGDRSRGWWTATRPEGSFAAALPFARAVVNGALPGHRNVQFLFAGQQSQLALGMCFWLDRCRTLSFIFTYDAYHAR